MAFLVVGMGFVCLAVGCGGAGESRTSYEVRSACGHISEILAIQVGFAVRPIDTLVVDSFSRVEANGCRVRWVSWTGAFTRGYEPDEAVRLEMERRGWIAALERQADGPDGTGFGMAKEDVLYTIQENWGGGMTVTRPTCLGSGPDSRRFVFGTDERARGTLYLPPGEDDKKGPIGTATRL